MTTKVFQVLATGLVVAIASSTLGCATFRKEALRKEGASAYVYPKPIEKLWPDVQQHLKDEGYGLRAGQGYTLVTDPKETSPGSGQWITLLVQGKAMDPGHSILRVFKKARGGSNLGGAQPEAVANSSIVTATQTEAQMNAGQPTPAIATAGLARDTELEWKLIQKLDPQGAEQISAEADRIVEGKSGGMDVARAEREREQSVRGTSASSPGGPVSLEDALEAERAKKRLVPAVWIPATAGAVLIGTGLGFEFSARHAESRLIDGDITVGTYQEVQDIIAGGKRDEAIGLTLITAGATSLLTAMVLHYSGVVRPKTPEVTLAPTSGGAMAVVGGSF